MLPAFQQMTLFSQFGTAEIITLWHFRSLLQEMIFTRDPSSLRSLDPSDSVISSAEGAKDKVAKFTSLVRARTNYLFCRSW